MKPILIGQLARAGRQWNLVPVGRPLPGGIRPADLLGAALVAPVGRDYVGAVRARPQAQMARAGTDVLVLAGVRPPGHPADRAALVGWLERKLDELETTMAAPNETAGATDFQGGELLARWGREAVTAFRLRVARPRRNRVPFVVLATGIALAATAAGVRIWQAGRPPRPPDKAPAEDPARAAWTRFEKKYPDHREPDLAAIWSALAWTKDAALPRNFDALPKDKKVEQLLKVGAFRDWLLKNFPAPPATDFTPFLGDVGDADRQHFRKAGELGSMPAVLAARDRLARRADILRSCDKLPVPDLDDEQLGTDLLALFRWKKELAAKAPGRRIEVGVPFVSAADLPAWKYVIGQDRDLRAAVARFPGSKVRKPMSLADEREAVVQKVKAAGSGPAESMGHLLDLLKGWPEDEPTASDR